MDTIQGHSSCNSKLPTLSLLMAILGCILFYSTTTTEILQFDREAIAQGQLWRLLSGHWTHWSFDHFLWCTIALVALGSLCERYSPKGLLATVAGSSIFIPMVIWIASPEMVLYRGLSGICSGVFFYAAITMLRIGYQQNDRPSWGLALLAILFFSGKIYFEASQGHTLFVHSETLFTPAPLAHLAGGASGLVTALLVRPLPDRPLPVVQSISHLRSF